MYRTSHSLIANSNYKKLGKDIPNVTPAYNDAQNIKKYFTASLGVREGNIIYLTDATTLFLRHASSWSAWRKYIRLE